jgi:CRISPR type III-B/RAMP module RAMP protein Cmr6
MTVTATNQVCDALGGPGFPKLESPSLRLEKFVRLEHANKYREVDAVVKIASQHQLFAKTQHYSAFPTASATVQQLQSRLIVNQAGGVLENAGLCLHRHFGFPTIPGSAVKGAARHHAWLLWQDAREVGDDSQASEYALKLALTFGFPSGDRTDAGLDAFLITKYPDLFANEGKLRAFAGGVAFFPAQPVGKAKLVTDIVTCHHPEYYSTDRARATDDENPIPNPFPAVEAGTAFEFAIAPVRRNVSWACKLAGLADFIPVDFAMHCLKQAVEVNGIGAKTNAGYGWFAEDPSVAKAQKIEAALKLKHDRERQRALEQAEQDRLRKEQSARLKAEKESAINAQEEARAEAARNASLEELDASATPGDIRAHVNKMVNARDSQTLSDTEKETLRKKMQAAIENSNKKQQKRLLNLKRSKELWRDLRNWLGEEIYETLKMEVGAK